VPALRDVLVLACGCAALLADVVARAPNADPEAGSAAENSAAAAPMALLQTWLPLANALGPAVSPRGGGSSESPAHAVAARLDAEANDEAGWRVQLMEALCPSDPGFDTDYVRTLVNRRSQLCTRTSGKALWYSC